MPVNKGKIPCQSDLQRWPHLGDVYLPEIDPEVELLIGTNIPKTLEPLQVIRSVDDGPYAIKTILVWTVNGPLGGDSVEGIYVATIHKNLSPEFGGALAAAVQSRFLHCFYVEDCLFLIASEDEALVLHHYMRPHVQKDSATRRRGAKTTDHAVVPATGKVPVAKESWQTDL